MPTPATKTVQDVSPEQQPTKEPAPVVKSTQTSSLAKQVAPSVVVVVVVVVVAVVEVDEVIEVVVEVVPVVVVPVVVVVVPSIMLLLLSNADEVVSVPVVVGGSKVVVGKRKLMISSTMLAFSVVVSLGVGVVGVSKRLPIIPKNLSSSFSASGTLTTEPNKHKNRQSCIIYPSLCLF